MAADAPSNSFTTAGEASTAPLVPVSYTTDTALAAETPDLDAEFRLAGTVELYERHVFLCYKGPDEWPSRIEDAETDNLPGLLSATIQSRKGDLKKITKFTFCEGEEFTVYEGEDFPDSSNGDVLIFPDMIRYKGLTLLDVNSFVEEVLVKDNVWLDRPHQTLTGFYVFVCCHGGWDKTCRISGPAVILRFYDEICARNFDQVTVSACSHVGDDKHSGNIIIFGSDANGEVGGHWYGNVLPFDVPVLMLKHIAQGEIFDYLWRGQMGLTQKQQREKALKLRNMTNGRSSSKISLEGSGTDGASCCLRKKQEDQSVLSDQYLTTSQENGKESSVGGIRCEIRKMIDTYAPLAIITAAVSVFAAFRVFKN